MGKGGSWSLFPAPPRLHPSSAPAPPLTPPPPRPFPRPSPPLPPPPPCPFLRPRPAPSSAPRLPAPPTRAQDLALPAHGWGELAEGHRGLGLHAPLSELSSAF